MLYNYADKMSAFHMALNISNAKNRDAVVAVEGIVGKREIRYVDSKGKPTMNRRVLKAECRSVADAA